ncbi:MAG: hypothetical protein WCQ41_09500 [Bacillota bacterium]
MNLKRSFMLILAFVVLLSFTLAGCNPEPEKKVEVVNPVKVGKVYKFDPPVTITTIRFYGPNIKFIKGEDIDNNVWTRAYESYCGIKLKSLFTVTDFAQFDLKVTTSIATDSLPDLIPVYTTLFFRISNSGKLADLKPAYDSFLNPDLKDLMEKANAGVAYNTCFRNGILAAIASPPDGSPGMQWIRQDWLDKFKLSWPKNINDSINIMKTFCSKNAGAPFADKTFAMPFDTSLSPGFASAYGSYSGIWVDDGSGGLVRGETQDKWKKVLQLYSDLYNSEYIDPDFTLSNSTTLEGQMTNQQFGMEFGSSSSPDGPMQKSLSLNPNAKDWKQSKILDEAGQPAKVRLISRVTQFTCVNKNSKYPGAVMVLANVYGQLLYGIGEKYRKYHDFFDSDGSVISSFFYPIVQMSYPPLDYTKLETKDPKKLTGEQLGIISYFKSWAKNKDPISWRMWVIYKDGGAVETSKSILKDKNFYLDRAWGPETQAWIDKGPDLSQMQTQIFAKIVRGDFASVDEGFNQWITYFNNNGGAEATTEINDWWKSQGKSSFAQMADSIT